MNTEEATRVEERRELVDIALDLLAMGDAEAKLKAGHTLLKLLDDDAKARVFFERYEARQRISRLAEEVRATGNGLLRLAEWLDKQGEAL
jgi:hypothetical protein